MSQSQSSNHIRLMTLAETHPCSYLEGEQSNSVFIDSETPPSWRQYSELSRMGFRRSGRHYYRPHCPDCNQCKSVRIRCLEFDLNRKSRKRLLKKGRKLIAAMEEPVFSLNHYDLYERYVQARHGDGDMYPPSVDQYRSFLLEGIPSSRFFTLRNQKGELKSATLIDVLDDGISAVYTYFDPNDQEFSLGTLAVLKLAELCKAGKMPYIYLGYWVKNSPKMAYKRKFAPLDVLDNEKWHLLSEEN